MKTIETILGDVTVQDIRMVRKGGQGQYNIELTIEHEGIVKTIKEHSTNSTLYDEFTDADDKQAFLLDALEYTINRIVDDYISSL